MMYKNSSHWHVNIGVVTVISLWCSPTIFWKTFYAWE